MLRLQRHSKYKESYEYVKTLFVVSEETANTILYHFIHTIGEVKNYLNQNSIHQ